MSKSHVAVAQHQCPVCGKVEDANEVLLHRRMAKVFDPANPPVTGFGLCKQHQQQRDEGYVFLVEMKSQPKPGSSLQDSWPLRTGNHVAVRASVWDDIFNVPAPRDGLCFIGPGVIEKLQAMQPGEGEDA